MDTDSMDSQVDPPWPPWGAGAPLFGQNKANWRGYKKWLSWLCYKSKKKFPLSLNWTHEYRKNLTLKLFWSGPFLIQHIKKNVFSLGSLILAWTFFPPINFWFSNQNPFIWLGFMSQRKESLPFGPQCIKFKSNGKNITLKIFASLTPFWCKEKVAIWQKILSTLSFFINPPDGAEHVQKCIESKNRRHFERPTF